MNKQSFFGGLKMLTVVFYATIATFFIILPYVDSNFIKGSDFVSFVTGAKTLASENKNLLYDIDTQFKYQKELTKLPDKSFLLPFRNPPFVSIFYTPYLHISLETSFVIGQMVSIFCIYATLCLVKHLHSNLDWKSLSLIFFFWPVVNSLFLGQFTPFIFFIFGLLYYFLRKSKHFLSGIVVGVLTIKPQLLLVAPYIFILSKDKKKFFTGLLLGVFLFMCMNILVGGGSLILDYIRFLGVTERADFGSRYNQMFSLYPVAQTIFGTLPSRNLVFALLNMVSFFGSLYLFVKNKFSNSLVNGFSLSILLSLIFSPHLLSHDLILLGFPLVFSQLKEFYLLKNKLLMILLYLGPLLVFVNKSWIYGVFLILMSVKILLTVGSRSSGSD